MKRFATFSTLLSVIISPVRAEVVINEISGASSDRLLKYSDSGQASLGAGSSWFSPAFDAAAWSSGAGPIGFGRPELNTDLSSVLPGEAPSLYLRKSFFVSAGQAASTANLVLETRFADGLIIFINGVEAERYNLGPPGLFIYSDQLSFLSNPDDARLITLNLGPASDWLVEGENVIAVQVAGNTLSRPVHFEGELRIDAGVTLYDVVTDFFSDANGASRTHLNNLGVINESSSGMPVVDGWLDRSLLVESNSGWEQLEITTLSESGGGEQGDGAIRYTVAGSGGLDDAVISFPEVEMGQLWEAGNLTAGDLSGTRISFRLRADSEAAFDFVVRSSDGEVVADGFSVVTSGAEASLGYWRFDEANAQAGATLNQALDSTGNGHIATPSGSGGGVYASDVPGALIFDPLANATRPNQFSMDVTASGRRMRVVDSPDFNRSFTAEMFIKIDGEPSGYNPFLRRQGPSNSRWQIDFDHAPQGAFGRIRSRLDTPDGANTNFTLGPMGGGGIPAERRIWIDTDSSNGLVSGYNDPSDWSRDGNGVNDRPGWHHVALTLDQGTGMVRLYYDYQLMQTRTLAGAPQGGYVHPSGVIEFGKFSSTYAMLIDEVRYTGRVLEPADFLQVATEAVEPWITYEIDLGSGDPVSRAALLSHLNAGNETSFVPGLQLRNESFSEDGRTLDLDQFNVVFAEGVGANALVSSSEAWRYHAGLIEPSGGVSEPGAPAGDRRDFVDWIELANTGGGEVDLTGWSLTDDQQEPRKWTFPPGTTIPAQGYLVVLADELENDGLSFEYLHTNFKLAGEGEYLALIDDSGVRRTEFAFGFPRQDDFYSFGLRPDGEGYVYFKDPSPGRSNGGPVFDGFVSPPVFGVPGGFHPGTVVLPLTSETPGATIRYTTDGTEPTLENGLDYLVPLVLARINSRTGHTIRARAFAEGSVPSQTRSATYLVGQSGNITSSPALILSGDEGRSFLKPYGVLAIDGGLYVDARWEAREKDDYNLPLRRGRVYERPAFVEFYQANSTNGFGVNGGIRVALSNYSRPRIILNNVEESPWVANPREKPSFNLYFRNEYERSRIQFSVFGSDYAGNSFEQLRPRAGKNDMNNPHIKDEVVRRLFIEMGNVGSRGVFNNLYLNGEWKGFYNTCERLREPFFQTHYPGSDDWDIRQAGNPNGALAEGDNEAWNELNNRLQVSNVNSEGNWNAVLELVDPVSVADYFLLNIYTATWDWPNNNWVSARERSPEGRFRFYVWDAEGGFGFPRSSQNPQSRKPVNFNTIAQDLLARTDVTSTFFQRLHRWPAFRLILADRIHRHFFNGGVLDDSNPDESKVKAVIDEAAGELSPLLQERLGESVDLEFWRYWTNPGSSRRSYLLGPNDEHFRDAGYWPETEPPTFVPNGGEVSAGSTLTMSAGSGTIFFTTDGSDPRLFGGGVSPSASSFGFPVQLSPGLVTVKARLRGLSGEWSALTEAEFMVGLVPADSSNLVISEIHYHPAPPNQAELAAGFDDQDDFEMIRLQNIGNDPIDLRGVSLVDGVLFHFKDGEVEWLSPGASVIVASHVEAFRLRYGSAFDSLLAGQYVGSLSNGGEQVTLEADGVIIRSFVYDDQSPWPEVADGDGVSLLLIDPASNPDHGLAASWQRSASIGGHPGGQPLSLTYAQWTSYLFSEGDLADPNDDPDGDGIPNLIEFFLGSFPDQVDPAHRVPVSLVIEEGGERFQAMRFSQLEVQNDLAGSVQESADLVTWTNNGIQEILPAENQGNGWVTRTFRVLDPIQDRPQSYLRLRVTGVLGN